MVRLLPIAFVLTLLPPANGQESISPETLDAVKKATVYIRVEIPAQRRQISSGSGFVISTDGAKAIVVTNHHVVDFPARGRPTTVSVVFDSGTKTERTGTAEVVASDAQADLAVLRVTGVEDLPKPIEYSAKLKLIETTPVYTFGFPFGEVLATKIKGYPAITVGKASISSLRTGDDGELAMVQIDGNLNPGNSGRPIVDAKGRLVGVAVAKVKNSNGIGLAIPPNQLNRVLDGQVSLIKRHTVTKLPSGKFRVRCEADVIDPLNRLRGGKLYYRLVPGTEAGSDKG